MDFSFDFPRYFPDPCCTGVIRATAEDFQVDENLGIDFAGQGEHLFIQVRKRHQNTQWLAKQIAQVAGVKPQDVAYAGLKDRHAVTTQWFSVWLPGKGDPEWSALESDNVQIIQTFRHTRKLKRGGHLGNRFKIVIRDLRGADNQIVTDQALGAIESRLQQVKEKGVPNYFGEQRFGIDGGNLTGAAAWFQGDIKVKNRQLKGFYLSAARSYLFNLQLAERLKLSSFDQSIPGDIYMTEGSTQLFSSTPSSGVDASEQKQLDSLNIHPTALLVGRGRTLPTESALMLEKQVVEAFTGWSESLEKNGLVNERRAIRIALKTLDWRIEKDSLQLEFELPVGCFATAVLREICHYQTSQHNAAPVGE